MSETREHIDIDKLEKQRERIQAAYQKAQGEFRKLQREQAELPEALRRAALKDQQAIKKAAQSGTLKGAKTPNKDAVEERARELPYLLWASEIHVLELGAELAAAGDAEFEPKLEAATREYEEAEEALQRAEARLQECQWKSHDLTERRRELSVANKHTQGRLRHLEEHGPEL